MKKKLDKGEIAEVRDLYDGSWTSIRYLANLFNVSKSQIKWLVNYKTIEKHKVLLLVNIIKRIRLK